MNEADYFVRNALPPVSATDRSDVDRTAIFILTYKYPDRLGSVYERILREQTNVQTSAVATGIWRSPLATDKKTSLLLEGASSSNLQHRVVALDFLSLGDPTMFAHLMMTNLAAMMQPSGQSLWTGYEATITVLALRSGDAQVWDDLTTVAHSSGVTARVSFLSPSLYHYRICPDCSKQNLVRFLVSFLDDATVHGPLHRTLGSSYLMDWPLDFEVRNYVAMELAAVLGAPRPPSSVLIPEQWKDFRERMRARAHKLL
jgi:hypothetical protein